MLPANSSSCSQYMIVEINNNNNKKIKIIKNNNNNNNNKKRRMRKLRNIRILKEKLQECGNNIITMIKRKWL